MGLTNNSLGIKAVDSGLAIKKVSSEDKVVALAGNPNVGKSTVFNNLTGMNQHTGNWPGKTVSNAQGYCSHNDKNYVLVDIPGTYSLMAHSVEEEVARDFICFGNPDAVVVVCDATCLERNLNLVLQAIEITDNIIICVNLMDEAKRKGIIIDTDRLSIILGVPVVATNARKKNTLYKLMQALEELLISQKKATPIKIEYESDVETAINAMLPALVRFKDVISLRWLAIRLLDYDETLTKQLNEFLGCDLYSDEEINTKLREAKGILDACDISAEKLQDKITSGLVLTAEKICKQTVSFKKRNYNSSDRRIDRILTGKTTGIPVMAAMLTVIFWITLSGANYPSRLISNGLFRMQDILTELFNNIGAPDWLHGLLVLGMYRVVAWVVSVMLPPMAIFFPLFTLLEDLGYLPRVAFNLDKFFKKCGACGKQALTMCMGFGCNAAGVVGCRIIDSPRERLIGIITNNFVPCNGRFPTLIAILTMFFIGTSVGMFESILSALLLTCIILLGVVMTFAVSRLLSKTILKGIQSSFTLELPPYRRPQIGKVIVRSIFDRTLFVLGRALAVAAPAGLLIWVMANVTLGDYTLLAHCSGFLDPFARLLGMDGVILLAFILGFPANEIVFPIIIMAYLSSGSIMEYERLSDLRELLTLNGWSWITAGSTMLFSLMHWPCSTTCLTIQKETKSLKWTAISFVLPTLIGMAVCFVFANTARLFV
ncbi:MAG: ferrous iron transport protein B [Oscillospiraceae bacterium]|nr:ferrous iron transport protein B [Oscillospiraceae bacterium]MDD4413070.1 ferrous iron transport protein B [Oscillospiraceae bacterium]